MLECTSICPESTQEKLELQCVYLGIIYSIIYTCTCIYVLRFTNCPVVLFTQYNGQNRWFGVSQSRRYFPERTVSGYWIKQSIVSLYVLVYSSFRGSNTGLLDGSGLGFANVYNLIKDVQKSFRTREQEKKELEGYKEQEQLVLSINRGNPRLKDLYIRPLLTSRRVLVSHTHNILNHTHFIMLWFYRECWKLIKMVFVIQLSRETKLISSTRTSNTLFSRQVVWFAEH